jgi:GT2 family glycosyltransferase
MGESECHTVYIGIKHMDMAAEVVKNLKTTPYCIYIGDQAKCFSELVNNCIKLCRSSIFIFCSHRVSPSDDDIQRLVALLNTGFGYVGLYRFACFGIHIDILNKIGGFDEKFIPGECEDDDFKLRLQYNNIGFYEDHSVLYRAGISTWGDTRRAHQYFQEKYCINPATKTMTVNFQQCTDIDRSKYKLFSESIFVFARMRYYLERYHEYSIIFNPHRE